MASTAQRLQPLSFPNRDDFDFDGYATTLSFLRDKHLAGDSATPNFKTLNNEILLRQSDLKKTFALNLMNSGGDLDFPAICEPFGDEPLLPLTINDRVHEMVRFNASEWTLNHSVDTGSGYQGTIEWDNGGCGYGMPDSARGYIKLRKVWEGEAGKELFEGFLTVRVKYGSVLRRKGHGSEQDFPCSFWAVAKLAKDENDSSVEATDSF